MVYKPRTQEQKSRFDVAKKEEVVKGPKAATDHFTGKLGGPELPGKKQIDEFKSKKPELPTTKEELNKAWGNIDRLLKEDNDSGAEDEVKEAV